jgi:dipeptidyl-peptidase-3
MLLRLHMYRCTADVAACAEYYEALTELDGECLGWREAVLQGRPPAVVFVHGNTFLGGALGDGGEVVLREYEESVEGVVRSWAVRGV